jgi:hypothetical protein
MVGESVNHYGINFNQASTADTSSSN